MIEKEIKKGIFAQKLLYLRGNFLETRSYGDL